MNNQIDQYLTIGQIIAACTVVISLAVIIILRAQLKVGSHVWIHKGFPVWYRYDKRDRCWYSTIRHPDTSQIIRHVKGDSYTHFAGNVTRVIDDLHRSGLYKFNKANK